LTAEQVTAVLVALAAVITALGVLLQRVHELRKDLNGRLTQLLEERATAARKDGELAGRDYERQRKHRKPQSTETPRTAP
jgi:hypothetical protein